MSLSFLIDQVDREAIGQPALNILSTVYGDFLLPHQIEVEVQLVELLAIQELNATSRGMNEPTDVLSFPLFADLEEIRQQPIEQPVLLGSIVIAPEKATLYGETLPQLVHHGLLHICGFDHETDIISWHHIEEKICTQLAAAGLSIPTIPV